LCRLQVQLDVKACLNLPWTGDGRDGTDETESQAADLEEEKFQLLDKILEDDEEEGLNLTRKKENERIALNEAEEEVEEDQEEQEEEEEEDGVKQ